MIWNKVERVFTEHPEVAREFYRGFEDDERGVPVDPLTRIENCVHHMCGRPLANLDRGLLLNNQFHLTTNFGNSNVMEVAISRTVAIYTRREGQSLQVQNFAYGAIVREALNELDSSANVIVVITTIARIKGLGQIEAYEWYE